jgi:protein-disulfide isomerase
MKRISQILAVVLALVGTTLSHSLWTSLSADGGWSGLSLAGFARAQTATAAADLGPRREGDDMVLGRADAPLVLIEYASMTCPACARFHNEVLPRLKSQYIDGGQLKLVYRDFPLDRVALQAAQLARCVPTERYFAFLEVLYRQQDQWAAGRDPGVMIDRIKQLAVLAGLPRERASACVEDQSLQLKIVATAQAGEREFRIASTPSLVLNGKRYTGALNFEDLDKALREALRRP